jgi:hypothetical protein
MFWCLYYLKNNIYYIDDLNLLVLYQRKKNVLSVFDIVGRNVPPFSVIYPYIGAETDIEVEFYFMVDKLNLEGYHEVNLGPGNLTHLLGKFPLEDRNFVFPYTLHA